jgi:hypothetical protein
MADLPRILDAADPSSPALANSAVARSTMAWEKAYRATFKETGLEVDSQKAAADAFRAALPPLTSRENSRDFIACVAQGMLLGAIDEKHGAKLLYAVQIALTAASAQEKSQEAAGYAVYATLTDSEARCAQKLMPQRSRKP